MKTLTILDDETAARVRRRLLDLAFQQDELAAREAAATPYWKPQPDTVQGHRCAAEALRVEADFLLRAGRAS
jgi:hypothetical protein